MPTSDASVISTILLTALETKPQRVLDIGPGCGKYGFLLREYLGEAATIDAVEPWPKAMLAPSTYDTVWINPWPEHPVDVEPYDLILMIDVVEHYPWIDGMAALERAVRTAPRVIVSTPHRPAAQGTVGGNIYEAHVSVWTFGLLESVSAARASIIAHHSEQILALLERNI